MDDTERFPVRSFYSLRGPINNIDENAVPDGIDTIDIIHVPPPVDELTDEEDLDEDVIDDEFADPSFLPPEVSGTVELHQYEETRSKDASDTEYEQPQKKTKSTKSCSIKWKKKDQIFSSQTQQNAERRREELKLKLRGKCDVELFELFLTDELLEIIVDQSEKYATQKNRHGFSLTSNCQKKFLGILLFSGYRKLPSEWHYWSLDEDLDTGLVRNSMPRNRYTEIKRYLHFANNENAAQNTKDKAFKLRPVMDYLNKKFRAFGIFSRELSIDEQIVTYYGKHGLKQFLRGKPIRFGFKQWILCCGSTGYCYQMNLYQGKEERNSDCTFEETLRGKVVLEMIQHLDIHSDHEIYMDNFFTSHKLLAYMKDIGIRLTGTTRANRTAKCPLQSDKDMKQNGRGSYDYRVDENNEILFVKWNDNNMFTMGSNHQSITPLGSAKRWCRKDNKTILIPQPKFYC
ncbi:hypothetical protein Pcinc_016491 [Petrolisthes cinctipes]|uniref:PiggyBac transposable element-derived protein domain-containing protein n=1 Tax=Petrolisthes cinctipes TaxID=88211 RepID=A0AAE1KQY7_PETCI|nr:hypothetical protein Pcinc_016491 [Petrolisthes cinctipes]